MSSSMRRRREVMGSSFVGSICCKQQLHDSAKGLTREQDVERDSDRSPDLRVYERNVDLILTAKRFSPVESMCDGPCTEFSLVTKTSGRSDILLSSICSPSFPTSPENGP